MRPKKIAGPAPRRRGRRAAEGVVEESKEEEETPQKCNFLLQKSSKVFLHPSAASKLSPQRRRSARGALPPSPAAAPDRRPREDLLPLPGQRRTEREQRRRGVVPRSAGHAAAGVRPRRPEKEVGREPQRDALPERRRVLHVVDVALMREVEGGVEREWRGKEKCEF